jgi:hypothetical protein
LFFNIQFNLEDQDAFGEINKEINDVVTVSSAKANNGCFETCLTGLDACSNSSNPDCTFKWTCDGFCGCSYSWIEYGEYSTGSCDKSNSEVGEN